MKSGAFLWSSDDIHVIIIIILYYFIITTSTYFNEKKILALYEWYTYENTYVWYDDNDNDVLGTLWWAITHKNPIYWRYLPCAMHYHLMSLPLSLYLFLAFFLGIPFSEQKEIRCPVFTHYACFVQKVSEAQWLLLNKMDSLINSPSWCSANSVYRRISIKHSALLFIFGLNLSVRLYNMIYH